MKSIIESSHLEHKFDEVCVPDDFGDWHGTKSLLRIEKADDLMAIYLTKSVYLITGSNYWISYNHLNKEIHIMIESRLRNGDPNVPYGFKYVKPEDIIGNIPEAFAEELIYNIDKIK